jgi:hypothetical protein
MDGHLGDVGACAFPQVARRNRHPRMDPPVQRTYLENWSPCSKHTRLLVASRELRHSLSGTRNVRTRSEHFMLREIALAEVEEPLGSMQNKALWHAYIGEDATDMVWPSG